MKCRAYKTVAKDKVKRPWFFQIGLILYLLLLTYLCFCHIFFAKEIPQSLFDLGIDKIVHFIMFFPFPILANFARLKKIETKAQAFSSFALLIVYGFIIAGFTEVVQSLLPYRSEDIMDYLADCISIFISSLLVLIFNLIKIKKRGQYSL